LTPWLKSFMHDSPLPREQLASIVKNLLPSRRKRAAGTWDAASCPADKTITEEVVMDELMPIYYTPEELQACLQGVTLVTHLALMMQYPFTDQQLAVLKKKLDEVMHGGRTSRHLLGHLFISSSCQERDPENVASSLLPKTAGGMEETARAWIARESLWVCLRTSAVLSGFALFCFFPTPGGAPGEDLRALSKDNVNMDIGTFMSLKKDSVLNLTADDIKGLLGLNLDDLKNQQYNSPAKDWIRLQRQSELNKLDIGLTGGIPDGYISLPPKVETCVGCLVNPGTDNLGGIFQLFQSPSRGVADLPWMLPERTGNDGG
uniref:Uncharacterized protein n=1 Tax=Chelydra serpentina TaxID=8475 RepID=A0A8C3SGM2_CHESE